MTSGFFESVSVDVARQINFFVAGLNMSTVNLPTGCFLNGRHCHRIAAEATPRTNRRRALHKRSYSFALPLHRGDGHVPSGFLPRQSLWGHFADPPPA
jgi:hypothetical protein